MLGHAKELEFLKTLAATGSLAHGYIFFGAEGVGKKTVAIEFARFLENISNESVPLQDALVVSPDEKRSIGIDAVRSARAWLSVKPAASPRRTLIIEDAERMTDEAQNALLKVAEEVPGAGLIILTLRDPEELLPTVSSRFQKTFFSPVGVPQIAEWLQRELGASPDAAARAARRSFGSPGVARRILSDEEFKKRIETAERFLKRNILVKDLVKDDSFQLENFLQAVILVLSWESGNGKSNAALWHETLKLRADAGRLNLNPRIQLEALMSNRE